ncbi:MAG: MFS transporter [Oscillospiraceae bacterium]|nr:MFS transporter [Oscillospiraceae bacterium]
MRKEWKIVVCVFLIAMAFGLNITGIAPVLGMVQENYSSKSTSVVQLMQTLPYGLLIVSSLMLGWLTARVTKKKLALLSLVIIGLIGFLPFLSESFSVLLISRLLIGFGFGIVGPINSAIITDFIPAERRAKYFGLNVIGMGIGAMIGNLLGGILAKSGLRYFYLVYLMAIISFIVVLAILPELPITNEQKTSRQRLNFQVFLISGVAFMHTLFINVYMTNVSMYITQNITEDPSVSGIATALMSVAQLIMGISFYRITRLLKRATLPASLFIAVAGFAAVLFIPGMGGVVIASFFCGASLSCFNAMGAFMMSTLVKPEAVAKASGVFSILGGIGGLISPIVLNAASSGMLGSSAPKNQFMLAMIGMLIVGAILSVLIAKGYDKAKPQE